MREKTVRDMSSFERKRHSLEARIVRAAVLICISLGVVLLAVGLSLYTVSLVRQYVTHAFYLSQNAAQSVQKGSLNGVGIAEQVLEIYRSLSAEEQAKTGTEEYRALFQEIKQNKDYHAMKDYMLPTFAQSKDVSDVYLAMYDGTNNRLVYICDPAEWYHFDPGEWESVEKNEADKFLNWDGEGMLYHLSVTKEYGWLCTAGTPVYNKAGEICCFALVDVSTGNILAGMSGYALQITAALLIMMVIASWLVLRNIKKSLVTPINEIAAATQNYVEDRRAGKKDADHFAALNIHSGDEVENLSLVMADMERTLSEYEKSLTSITAEKERISTELALAARIQSEMLPSTFPLFPEHREFDIYAMMEPAKEVGGDFYDIFLIDDDHLCMVMADVAGKGIPAALFMMSSRSILANNAITGKSPAAILADTNTAICKNNPERMFVTVWLGILEISTGKLTAANAGHEYPVIKQPDGKFGLIKDGHGLMIGFKAGIQYPEYELTLEKGTKLFVYTDGVPEATNAQEELFGKERMLAALNEHPDGTPEEILNSINRAVDKFVQDAEQFDDLTMLCLEYKGTAPADELTVEADERNLPQVQEFINERLLSAGCSEDIQAKISIATEEIFLNIAHYAYEEETGSVTVSMEVSEDPPSLTITFKDHGIPYDPTAKPDPDLSVPLGKRPIGGLGIFLSKNLMDDMVYENKDGQNILSMKKLL